MKKGKLLIIIFASLTLSLLGFLIINSVINRNSKLRSKDNGTASAMAVSPGGISSGNEDSSANYTYIPPIFEYDDNNSNEDIPIMTDITPTGPPWTPATEMDLDPKSITVFVNREYALPKDYIPEDMVEPKVLFDVTGLDDRKLLRFEAAAALEDLFAAAVEDGYTLYGISGYRSYDRQKTIFRNNIVTRGKKHTIKYSAVPGASEHQTGLSIDVSSKSMKYRLITTFATCSEGIWLANNAYRFGYIIRYPKNRVEVTGYAYEPWHIRYVGKELAHYLYKNSMTLEEYYNYIPSSDFDFEETYADLINYIPPTPVPVTGDLNGDGIVDDLNNDGIIDDINGDGISDDLDGDGIIDDLNGDGIIDDINGDGISDDLNGDGIVDDINGDGISDDLDGDGIVDDLNGDGIIDDINGDGISDDLDGDGIVDDLNGDGIIDDINGDGISDDLDGDGIVDDLNGDGIIDDLDGNGIPDVLDSVDDDSGEEDPIDSEAPEDPDSSGDSAPTDEDLPGNNNGDDTSTADPDKDEDGALGDE